MFTDELIINLALGMSPCIPVCPLHQLVCTGQAALVFCLWHGKLWKGCAPLEWGELDTDRWDGFSAGLCHSKANHGSCQSEEGVFCLCSVCLRVCAHHCALVNWGSIILFAVLEQCVIIAENPEIIFCDMALVRVREQHSCHLPIFYSDYFALGLVHPDKGCQHRSCSSGLSCAVNTIPSPKHFICAG